VSTNKLKSYSTFDSRVPSKGLTREDVSYSNLLPEELLTTIFKLLDDMHVNQMSQIRLVCLQWSQVSNDLFWLMAIRDVFPDSFNSSWIDGCIERRGVSAVFKLLSGYGFKIPYQNFLLSNSLPFSRINQIEIIGQKVIFKCHPVYYSLEMRGDEEDWCMYRKYYIDSAICEYISTSFPWLRKLDFNHVVDMKPDDSQVQVQLDSASRQIVAFHGQSILEFPYPEKFNNIQVLKTFFRDHIAVFLCNDDRSYYLLWYNAKNRHLLQKDYICSKSYQNMGLGIPIVDLQGEVVLASCVYEYYSNISESYSGSYYKMFILNSEKKELAIETEFEHQFEAVCSCALL
jgi:hypothetical protein